jgi:CO/xanthine dehydrogenase Mo-binding subunit
MAAGMRIDWIAREPGIDSIEFRLRNAFREGHLDRARAAF